MKLTENCPLASRFTKLQAVLVSNTQRDKILAHFISSFEIKILPNQNTIQLNTAKSFEHELKNFERYYLKH
jgi:S-ribosylhomocysteine lyase LuxS involved in autoinducer biosynthesis